jgi:SagB-type dehydrogenase family enzyme
MTWSEYHESTKHSIEPLRRAPHDLDWANMPDPFRQYEGIPVLDLPADSPVLETPALEVLHSISGSASIHAGPTFLSGLLFYSAAISASKRVPSTGYRYALRVNPSSGNLHPTELHFLTRGLKEWPDGLYHYRPSAHMAGQRALGNVGWKWAGSSAPIVLILTSIAWREAWKYRDRAYRYCLLDIGHAWQALALAARAAGCESFAMGHFEDNAVASLCRLHEDEWPMLIVELRGGSIPERQREACSTVWYGGHANQLSRERTAYPRIDGIHSSTKLGNGMSRCILTADPAPVGSGEIRLPPPAASSLPFGEVARKRRSALDFVGGMQSMSAVQLSAILAATAVPFLADFSSPRFIQLYLYIHRVDGLEPGVYRFWSERAELEGISVSRLLD